MRAQEEQGAFGAAWSDAQPHRRELPYLVEALHHGLIVAPGPTLSEFVNEFSHALHTSRFEECRLLLQATPPESEAPQYVSNWLALAQVALLRGTADSGRQLEKAKTILDGLRADVSPELRGPILHVSALIHRDLGNIPQALNELQEAVTAFDAIGDWQRKAGGLSDLACGRVTKG